MTNRRKHGILKIEKCGAFPVEKNFITRSDYDENLKKNKKKGFTLIELIVVITILAIIAALAIPSFNGVRENAAKEVATANARTAYTAGMAAEALADNAADIQTKFTSLVADMKKDTDTITWAADTNTATWKGSINGKLYQVSYSTNGAGEVTNPAS